MNQSLDLTRLGMLISKHWSENRKKYLLALAAILGLLCVWFGFVIAAEAGQPLDEGTQLGTYYFGLALVGCVYASMLFADLASRSRGINYLMVPASHLEKLVCNLFFAVVVFFICYTLVFYTANSIMLKLANMLAFKDWQKTHLPGEVFRPGTLLNVFVMPHRAGGVPNAFFYILMGYFAVQSAFIAGSVYFPKFSFIKTVIAVLLSVLLIGFFVGEILRPMMPTGGYFNGITSYHFATMTKDVGQGVRAESGDKLVTLPGWIDTLLVELVKYAFIPIFWVVTFFRLKEKQV